MALETAKGYSDILKINLEQKLEPINETIDQMLVRLEEFQTMVILVQQEKCNSLAELTESKSELLSLCEKIEALEQLIEHIKSNMYMLEGKIEAAESNLGLKDNTTKIKTFLKPFFKKNEEASNVQKEMEIFSTEDYFGTET